MTTLFTHTWRDPEAENGDIIVSVTHEGITLEKTFVDGDKVYADGVRYISLDELSAML